MTNNKSIQKSLKPRTFFALKNQKMLFILLITFTTTVFLQAQCTITLPTYADGFVDDTGTEDVTILPLENVVDCDTFGLTVFVDGNPVLIGNTYAIGAGTHTVLYLMTDNSTPPNIVSGTTNFTLEDNITPTAVCHQSVVTLTNATNGMAMVLAVSVGDGSFDNVTNPINLDYKIKKASDPISSYASIMELTCDDIGFLVYDMQVTDEAGLTNVCSDTLFINDKIAPVLVCPGDMTAQCEDYIGNDFDAAFGAATATDACVTVDLVELDPIVNISPCGEGTIFREWIATDPYGNADTCSQIITIENQNNFDESDITWPAHYTVNDCQPSFELEDLVAPYDYPSFTQDQCAMLAVNYSDSHFTSGYEGCSKVYRVWTVLNMCEYDPMNPDNGGSWSHVQILTAMDTGAPVIVDCIDTTMIIGNYTADCGAQLATLPTPGYDEALECSPSELMEWHYSIMVYDATVDDYVAYDTGEGEVTDYFNNGLYKIDYTLSDPCGNTDGCWYMFEVKDLKKPTVGCQSGMAIHIMQSGMISITPEEFDYNSYDNCTDTEDLLFSFSADVTDVLMTFTCDHIGFNDVEMWVTDEAGNQEYCNLIIEVQDNGNNICQTPQMLSVAGLINVYSGQPVEDVQVMLNSADYNMTNEEGSYNFEVMSENDYELTPHRNDDVRNGVNTFDLVKMGRHLLETELFDSPYKIIAADVNGSGDLTGADIVMLRQIILFNMDELPAGMESWRFVADNYTFIDEQNPLDEDFDESININSSSDVMDANFIGVKIGDVTGDAQSTNDLINTDPRSVEVITVENESFEAGDAIEISLDLSQENLIGGQLEINFDTEVLSYQDISSDAANFSAQNVGLTFVNEGTILLSWTNASEEMILDFSFEAIGDGEVKNHFDFDDRYLGNELYVGADAVELALNFNTKAQDPTTEMKLSPNPWTESTRLTFEASTEESLNVVVTDLSGRVVLLNTYQAFKGVNTIKLDNMGYVPGVYILSLQGENTSQNIKMVIR